MRKPLVAIIGSESSGCRLATKITLEATRFALRPLTEMWRGNDVYPKDNIDGAVSRKSIPHGPIGPTREFFDPLVFHDTAVRCGWDPHFLFTIRDPTICCLSKGREHTRGNLALAQEDFWTAKDLIENAITSYSLTWQFLSFESMIMFGSQAVCWALDKLGILAQDPGIEVRNENEKYWRETIR